MGGGDEGCDHLQPPGGGTKSSGLANYPNGLNQETIDAKVERVRKQYGGECPKCGARRIDSQLGLDPTPKVYVANMVAVFREVRRVLKPDGVCWINLGDSYTSGNRTHRRGPDAKNLAALQTFDRIGTPEGLKPKDLVGIPWRVAFALQADGWYLRQDIIWHKPNPMPESVTDRCTKAHEYLFLLTKSARYYWDQEAIKEPSTASENSLKRYEYGRYEGNGNAKRFERTGKPDFLTKLGNNYGVNASWKGSRFKDGKNVINHPNVGSNRKNLRSDIESRHRSSIPGGQSLQATPTELRNRRSVWTIPTQPYPGAHFATFPEALVEPCILAGSRPGDIIFDPFGGSGTVARVAIKHNRSAVHCDLAYHELAGSTRCSKIQRKMF